jgi:class I fructose-bisphosphate aldolase
MGEPDSPQNCSVEYAREIGADAVGYTVYSGSNHEVEMYEEFRGIQENARANDLPVVMWSYPRGQGLKNDTSASTIAYAARIALEIGADIAKVKYPGDPDAMEQVVRAAGRTNVIMSGGSKTSDEDFLKSVKAVMDAGGTGLAVGRNVWQRENPEELLDALEDVIYEGKSVDAVV